MAKKVPPAKGKKPPFGGKQSPPFGKKGAKKAPPGKMPAKKAC